MSDVAATFVAAGVAAAMELSLMQPLDVVKTRHQIGSGAPHTHSTRAVPGGWRVFHARLRLPFPLSDLPSLWSGFGPGLAIVVPRRGLKFAVNGAFVSWLGNSPGGSLVAGAAAGACEAVVITRALTAMRMRITAGVGGAWACLCGPIYQKRTVVEKGSQQQCKAVQTAMPIVPKGCPCVRWRGNSCR